MAILLLNNKEKHKRLTMKVFESNNGKIEKIRDGHFKVTIFSELGYYSFEKRHTTLDDVIYNNLI